MCTTCGCDQPGSVTITKVNDESKIFKPVNEKVNLHRHQHHGSERMRIDLETDILSKNNIRAQHNRHHFEAGHILALNLVSSPGSGKTCLLERTLRETKTLFTSSVIEGDQQTMQDANRIAATGAPVGAGAPGNSGKFGGAHAAAAKSSKLKG